MRRAETLACWGSSYFGEDEFISEKIAVDKEWTNMAKNLMMENIYRESIRARFDGRRCIFQL